MEKQINTRVLSKIDTQSNWDMATECYFQKHSCHLIVTANVGGYYNFCI